LRSAVAFSQRKKVEMFETEMRKLPQIALRTRHYFSDGVYAREIFIPKGILLTGKVHKYAQLNIVSQGDISVLLEDGLKRVAAPFTVVSPPGTKRIAYAHADTVWTTIHRTDDTDLEVIEKHFVVDTEDEYLAFLNEAKLLTG